MARLGAGLVALALALSSCGTEQVESASTTSLPTTTGGSTTTTTEELPVVSITQLPTDTFPEGSRLSAVTRFDGLLVAVGTTHEEYVTDAAIWTSTDGATWTQIEDDDFVGDGHQVMLDVASGANGVVAVGSEGRPDDYDAAVWHSSDGAAWDAIGAETLGGSGEQIIWAIEAHDERLVAVGEAGGSPAVWASDDGTTWVRAAIDGLVDGGDAGAMYAITAGVPGLVAVGSTGLDPHPSIWVSPDGSWWTRLAGELDALGAGVDAADTTPGRFTAVTPGPDGLVAIAATAQFDWLTFARPEVWISSDGSSWTLQEATFLDTPTGTYATVTDVLWTSAGFIAIGGYAPTQPGGWTPGTHAFRLSRDGGTNWRIVGGPE
ncbi:MAG: hypothetical protein HKN93_10090, partial [Acidimicrobiia bacterium]|nr:hypothetical protein [Acidimicrobiia bacterium]